MHAIVWSFLQSRLRQSSTWAGIVSFVAGMLGISLKPEYANAITGVALAVSSLVCVIVDQHRAGSVLTTQSATGTTEVPAERQPAVRPTDPPPVRDRFGTGSNV